MQRGERYIHTIIYIAAEIPISRLGLAVCMPGDQVEGETSILYYTHYKLIQLQTHDAASRPPPYLFFVRSSLHRRKQFREVAIIQRWFLRALLPVLPRRYSPSLLLDRPRRPAGHTMHALICGAAERGQYKPSAAAFSHSLPFRKPPAGVEPF